MALETSEAIILDVYDLHEYDRIVAFLTRDFGKKRGVARGARRKFSRFAGQLQPLAKIRATWFEKPQSDLVRISSIEVVRSAEPLTRDLEGILMSGYLADHMLEFAQENEEDDLLFRLLDTTLTAICSGIDRALAARYFEAWVLRLSGLFPAPVRCPSCGGDLAERGAALSAGDDSLLCGGCSGGGFEVGQAALRFFRRIDNESLVQIAQRPPSTEVLAECEEVSGRVRRSFLQYELKSHRVMRETLAGLPRG
jgi:DNA repair protein RecO (recombination protein O)